MSVIMEQRMSVFTDAHGNNFKGRNRRPFVSRYQFFISGANKLISNLQVNFEFQNYLP